MKKHISFRFAIPLILASFFCSSLSAQSVLEKYEKETIYLSYNNYSYIKNGQKHWAGFFGKHLKKEMEVSPDAVIEFDRYQKKSITSFWMVMGAGAIYVSGVLLAQERDEYDALSGSMVLAGTGLMIASIPLTINSMKHYNKAIWLRNRDVLR
ncbi:MAG TPA: hypothetical protein ENJ95_15430 [Bacteroidetes bacterium]|nr:hypothetical protein [Bacteroidota bacterium]